MNLLNNRLYLATNMLRWYSASIVKPTRRTRRGTKAGRNVFRPIRSIVTSYRFPVSNQITSVNKTNLVQIVTSKNIPAVVNSIKSLVRPRASVKNQNSCNTSNLLKVPKSFDDCSNTTLSLVSLNARSVKNKATSVCDFLTSNNVDILALTKTWLGSAIDKSVIAEITPDSYDLKHISRNDRKGGGVAVIFNKNLDVKPVASKNSFSHFELLECNVSANESSFSALCDLPPSTVTHK